MLKNFVRRKDVLNVLEVEADILQELIDYNEMIFAKKIGKDKADIGRELVSLRIRLRQTKEILRYIEDAI